MEPKKTKGKSKIITGKHKGLSTVLASLLVLAISIMPIAEASSYASSKSCTNYSKKSSYSTTVKNAFTKLGNNISIGAKTNTCYNKDTSTAKVWNKSQYDKWTTNTTTTTTTTTPAPLVPETGAKPSQVTPPVNVESAPVEKAPEIIENIEQPIVPEQGIKEGAYYVSPSGNDSGNGTVDSPFKTIQKAANVAKAGDTVYIRQGTYREKVAVKNSGSAGKYITFSNYPGETVTLDGTGVSLGYYLPLFSVESHSYIIIQGIKVTNSPGQGIGDAYGEHNNSHIIVKDCSTYKTQISGVHFYKANNIVIDNVYIDTANLTENQEALTLAGVTDFEIKNCTVINAQKECIDVKDGCKNGKIYNNTVKNARLSSGLAIYVDGAKSGCSNIDVYDNTIDNCIQGIVVASELGGNVTDIKVRGNKISNSQYGIQVAGWGHIAGGKHPMDNIRMTDNKFSGNMSINLILSNPDAKNVFVTNNIFGGTNGTVPILVQGGDLAKTSIDGNSFLSIKPGSTTGTNYSLIK